MIYHKPRILPAGGPQDVGICSQPSLHHTHRLSLHSFDAPQPVSISSFVDGPQTIVVWTYVPSPPKSFRSTPTSAFISDPSFNHICLPLGVACKKVRLPFHFAWPITYSPIIKPGPSLWCTARHERRRCIPPADDWLTLSVDLFWNISPLLPFPPFSGWFSASTYSQDLLVKLRACAYVIS